MQKGLLKAQHMGGIVADLSVKMAATIIRYSCLSHLICNTFLLE